MVSSKVVLVCLGLAFLVLGCGAGRGQHTQHNTQPSAAASSQPADHWRLAPTGQVHRTRPYLVNNHHMSGPDNAVDHREERLAQWDVLILNPWLVRQEGISLEKIRRTHPGIVILAWVPAQGSDPRDQELLPGIPGDGPGDWFIHKPDGSYSSQSWSPRLLNPYTDNFAWPRHLIEYISKYVLINGQYDGVMFDCLWEFPLWDQQMDIDGDGKADTAADKEAWVAGISYLLRETRAKFPRSIITGNGGVPWQAQCPYYQWANGNMLETALSDLWEDRTPANMLRDMDTCLSHGKAPAMFFNIPDVRNGHTLEQARDVAGPRPDDLRRLRLGLTATLLRDGAYFGFDRGDCLHGQLWWFDEYDADLGRPLADYGQDSFGPGIYSRQYEKGLVVVNPTAASVHVKLDKPSRDVTTGQTAGDFDVPAQDGRIFLRVSR